MLHPSLFDTLAAVPKSESTPPLYYLVAWLWSRPFGIGEVGLRSLSALAGTASIVVVYLGAVALPLPRRAGLIARGDRRRQPGADLVLPGRPRLRARLPAHRALLPLLRPRRRSGAKRDLAWWAACSALALATHYFAGFVVAPEAALLLWGSAERRRVAVAIAAVLAAGALLLPIALRQAENAHAGWIAEQPLSQRLERAGAKLVGDDNGNEHGARSARADPARRARGARPGGAGAAALARRSG